MQILQEADPAQRDEVTHRTSRKGEHHGRSEKGKLLCPRRQAHQPLVPFDANARRQTSFAAVEVIPEITDDSKDVEIRPEDIEMQVYRSSGAGGQHINKTSSAVRLIHKPTGIVVSCQTQRDQFQNRETCMRMLRSKLIEIKEREHLDKISDIKGAQLKIEWGSQIRNYVFMPYTLVKDTRTGYETSNVNAVMDGGLDGFINAYLTCLATNTWVTKS